MKTSKKMFKMNDKVFGSMMDIARELGVKRVYPKDFEKYNITEISEDASSQDVVENNNENADTEVVENNDNNVVESNGSDDSVESEDEASEPIKPEKKKSEVVEKVEKAVVKKHVGTAEDVSYAQDNVSKLTVVEFNNFIKHFSISSLVEMAENAGVDTWEKVDNEPIRRMRLLMEIKTHYYPTDKTPVRPKSNWKKIGLDSLVELANQNSLEYRVSDDKRIQRMWVIFALNAAGLTPQDMKTETEEESANENA